MIKHEFDLSVAELETLDAPDFWSGLCGVVAGIGLGLIAVGIT